MKFISGFISLLLLVLALSFMLANRQDAVISFWPFGLEIAAPLYMLTLGTLLLGVLSGAALIWLTMVPHRMAARRLRKENAKLNAKIDDLQQAVNKHIASQQVLVPHHVRPQRTLSSGAKWRFWERES